MKTRSILAVLMVVAMGAVFAVQAVAQTEITVQNRSFAWTGKSGDTANYRWSATVNNPSGRELNLRVTMEMLNSAGEVVGQDSADVMIAPMDNASVEETASIAVSTAESARQYRVVLMEIE